MGSCRPGEGSTKRHRLRSCLCPAGQPHRASVFGDLVVAQQTYPDVKEAAMFWREPPRARRLERRSSLGAGPLARMRHGVVRSLSDEITREESTRSRVLWRQWSHGALLARRSSSEDVISEEGEGGARTWSAREEREFLRRQADAAARSRKLSEDVISEEAELGGWSRRGRQASLQGAPLSRGSSVEEQVLRRSSAAEAEDGRRRRASQLVDRLLLEIYGRDGRRATSAVESDCCSTSAASSACWRTEGYRPGQEAGLRAAVCSRSVSELRVMLGTLRLDVQLTGARLVRQLKRRDRLKARQSIQNSVLTAYLQAISDKTSEATRMRFSVAPCPGDSGFSQWQHAMKMVARLPGGIPPEFRRRLWLTLAERHLQERGVDWDKMQRCCFNEWTNPDDDELGVQIVKDLHRTGCSLFCGAQAEENQALLKRVLLAYARWNKAVGYCQGFNMLAALILQVMDRCEGDALKVMIHLIEGVLPESYFANNLRGLSVDMAVFRDLLRLRLPALSRHLEQLQLAAGDSGTGTSYEPPLTNVFTMQWFLTLFSNCLPQATVLRVWDLVFLEGNEVLLRTALAIWDGLADRIMAVESADEFYSIMGVLTREMLEFGLVDSNHLVKTIVRVAPFPFAEVGELRDRYLYNITPWTQTVSTAARRGLRLFYSDDDEESSEDEEKMAVAAAYGIAAVFRSPRRRDSQRAPSPGSLLAAPDHDRLALDVSALKQQYAKLRERQRQAHIILTACSRQTLGPSMPTPVAMNHLLLGKSALLGVRGRRLGPPPGAVPPLRSAPPVSAGRVARTPHAERRPHPGETLHWKDAARRRQGKATDGTDFPAPGPGDTKEREAPEQDGSDDDTAGSSSSSSTSTELCDEPDRLSDFDSEEPTSVSDASSYAPPSDNLLKIPPPSTDVSSSPSPELCPPKRASKGRTSPASDRVEDDSEVPSAVIFAEPDLPSQATNHSAVRKVIPSPSDSGPGLASQTRCVSKDLLVPALNMADTDMVQAETTPSQTQAFTNEDEMKCGLLEKPTDTKIQHHIYHKSMQGLTNIMNEICSTDADQLAEENIPADENSMKRGIDLLSPSSRELYCGQLITTAPTEGTDGTYKSRECTLHSISDMIQGITAANNMNEQQEISRGPITVSSLNKTKTLKDTDNNHSTDNFPLLSPVESMNAQELEHCVFNINPIYKDRQTEDLYPTKVINGKNIFDKAVGTNEMEGDDSIGVDSVTDPNEETQALTTVIIQSDSGENMRELSEVTEEYSLNEIGRRKSERALKIIQENFEILQRITQCQSRHSDRMLDAETSNSDDVSSSNSDQYRDDLHLVIFTDKTVGTTQQPELSESRNDDDSVNSVFGPRPTSTTHLTEKSQFFNSSQEKQFQSQLSVEVSERKYARSKSQDNFTFNNTGSETQAKPIILIEKNNKYKQVPTSFKPKLLCNTTPQSERPVAFPLNGRDDNTKDKNIVEGKIHNNKDLVSRSSNISQKSEASLEELDSKLLSLEEYHSKARNENSVLLSFAPSDYSDKFHSNYVVEPSETKLNGKESMSHHYSRLDDKRRSTIHTFDSNDRDALRSFNTSFQKSCTTIAADKCQDDIIIEKCKPHTNERLPHTSFNKNLKQFVGAKDSPSSPGSTMRNIDTLPEDDVHKEAQKETTACDDSYPGAKLESYLFQHQTTFSSELYSQDVQNSSSKRWSTGAPSSDVTDRPNPSTEDTGAPQRSHSSTEGVSTKSLSSLTLGTNELSTPPLVDRVSDVEPGPRRMPADRAPSESAYVVTGEDRVSAAAPKEADIELFPCGSRSGRAVVSPTRGGKKYDPFPPRATLRQPREVGIKLGLYSATSDADRRNSSKKP
ncbi:uncharacterized protein LOC134535110 isoform X2 [Bacillus rossius redtenbacheri]|uniref:uncharacterized protein LOC134535110 isoform X2 n=1 Tax=Bacillus rossius redtenbacheri TaxID=93214 RepID=UPI002FDE91DE